MVYKNRRPQGTPVKNGVAKSYLLTPECWPSLLGVQSDPALAAEILRRRIVSFTSLLRESKVNKPAETKHATLTITRPALKTASVGSFDPKNMEVAKIPKTTPIRRNKELGFINKLYYSFIFMSSGSAVFVLCDTISQPRQVRQAVR